MNAATAEWAIKRVNELSAENHELRETLDTIRAIVNERYVDAGDKLGEIRAILDRVT